MAINEVIAKYTIQSFNWKTYWVSWSRHTDKSDENSNEKYIILKDVYDENTGHLQRNKN